MTQHLATVPFSPDAILVSFHGIPKEYFDKGDPYYCHCVKTWRLLREALGWPEERFLLSFQSRFGPAEWLKPYTDETVKGLPQKGVKRLAVIAPGFAADCLETLEEIGKENAHYFHEAGGEHFTAIPCLNDTPDGLAVIEAVVARELKGWIRRREIARRAPESRCVKLLIRPHIRNRAQCGAAQPVARKSRLVHRFPLEDT